MKKNYRVCKNEEFSEIIHEHHSFANSSFILYLRKKKMDNARMGLSVSKKLGIAVVRNKIKRQVRMMLQEILAFEEYPYDGVLIVRKSFLNKAYDDNKKDLLKLFRMGKIN